MKESIYFFTNTLKKWCLVHKTLISIILAATALTLPFSPLNSEILNSTKFYNEGVKSFKEGDREKALELFIKASKINENYSLAHYGIGRVYLFQENKTEEAVKHLKKATILDPSFAKSFFYLGLAQLFTGKYNDSIQSFKKAYEKDITLYDSLYNISIAYDLKGDRVNSILYYKKYIYAKEKKDDDIF